MKKRIGSLKMNNRTQNKKLDEKIEAATKRMFQQWNQIDQSMPLSKKTLEISQNINETLKQEFENMKEDTEFRKTIEKRIRSRIDLGQIFIGNRVIKKIEITDNYNRAVEPLKSIAYYQLLPEMDAKNPITQILRWTISQPPCWVIWYTSPLFKGAKVRKKGEYLVAYSLTERESENYTLLIKLSHFACLGTSQGVDILLSYKELGEAITLVERFLPSILVSDLYSDQEFLQVLKNYELREISPLLE